jgi:hypothetical protein
VELDTRVKQAIYLHFAATTQAPTVEQVAVSLGVAPAEVRDAFRRLFASRVLVLETDGETIRMAPPFSAVATPQRVRVAGRDYVANCAWDAFGIPAALRQPGVVTSRCGQSGEAVIFEIGLDAPPVSDWIFHCAVPAARWWQDIVHT